MWSVLAAALCLAGSEKVNDDPFVHEVEAWRQARETRMRSDEGWLTVAGLFWLKEGENRLGSEAQSEVLLPAHSSPPVAGVLRLHKGEVTIEPAPGVAITLDGKPVGSRALRSDARGPADVLSLGQLRFFVIERSGRLAIRLRDLRTPARAAFAGLRWFPIRKEYRVVGRLHPHATPKKLSVPNVLGMVEEMISPGFVSFTLQGKELRLEPVYEGPDQRELFFIFRDRTSGHETYGAGRFFYADKPRDGEVILDFNKAFTPPCAFTRFATCALPPSQNHLPLRIEAGELNDGLAH